MTQLSVVDSITEDAASISPLMDATGGLAVVAPLIRVAGASSAKRAAERAAGGRAVKVVKKGGRFIVTVVSGGSATRCVVDAQSGQVLGCR